MSLYITGQVGGPPSEADKTGLITIIGAVTVANWALKLHGYNRRRKSGRRIIRKRLPRVKSRTTEPETQEETLVHHASARYFWYWLSAFWRKYSIKHSNVGLKDMQTISLHSDRGVLLPR
jgi:hypothetical protein